MILTQFPNCAKCNTNMKIGVAIYNGIDPLARYFVPQHDYIQKHPIQVINCYKCPKCGHSQTVDYD